MATGETDIQEDYIIGAINFQAPDEGTGTSAILVAVGIEAVSEGNFSASNNATKLSFKTGSSEAATEKAYINSKGSFAIKQQTNDYLSGLTLIPEDTVSCNNWSIFNWNNLNFSNDGNNIFVIKPSGGVLLRSLSTSFDAGITIQQYDTEFSNWSISVNGNLNFNYGSNERGYVNRNSYGQMNFTGQHRNIMNTNISEASIGLSVSSTGKFINTANTLEVSINDSLPVCVITTTDNDKKVFGVLSDKEDTNSNREYSSGNFVSIYNKQNTNEQRMYINSVGEGGIWVSNKNGTLENGDYISSSTVPGYGTKQSDDLLHNYTVTKITCDCNFSTTQIVKQKLSVTTTTDSDGNTTTSINYDTNGDVQYEDDLDSNGSQQLIYPLDTRFLLPDGTQITEEDYTTRLGNGETVYTVCFVDCTYHCG